MRKITSSSTVGLLLAFTLLVSGAGRARAAIDATGAATLKKAVAEDMQWRVDMAKILGSGLTMAGKVSVVPKKSFYEVTLPHVAMLAGPKGLFYIGTVVLHAVPGDSAGSWKIDGALPPVMTFVTGKNKPLARIKTGSQHFSATWLPGTEIYPDLAATFKNIKVSIYGKVPADINIDAVQSRIALKEANDGKWNGDSDFKASGITVRVPGENPVTLTVGKASDHAVYDGLDVQRATELRAAMQAALKNGLPQTAEEKQAFITKFLIAPPVRADGVDCDFTLDNLAAHDKGTAKDPAHSFSLRHLALTGSTQDAQREKSRVRLTTAFSGLDGTFISPPFADIIPRDFSTDITVDNLPLKAITDMFFSAVQKFAAIPASDVAARKLAAASLQAQELMVPGLMEKAGTSLAVKDTYARSSGLYTRLAGDIYANPAAASGAVGKMTLSISGLDALIQKMKKEALAPNADPRLLVYLGEMAGLQQKGVETKVDGKPARAYVLELTQGGSVLLNGKEIRKSPAEQAGMTEQAAPQAQMQTAPQMSVPPKPAPAP
ncbi:MAG: hypothetical protein KGL10_08355 [Alphaproteobacteria bacterium]|nr:hypothetical protein [Alphaproteobacteria bacterium]